MSQITINNRPHTEERDQLKKEEKVHYLESTSSISSREFSKESKNPFEDLSVAEYYRNFYESCKYECRGVFDPEFTWTEEEGKNLIRKLDWRLALTDCFMFVALQVDRGNLSQAVADNLLDDLNMTTNDYNVGNQIFFVCFLVAEVPSQLISKKLGPNVFIPLQMVS